MARLRRIKRNIYFRMKNSKVWHFMENCRFWPPARDPEQDYVVSSVKRPRYGYLCDYCQATEKRDAKRTAR